MKIFKVLEWLKVRTHLLILLYTYAYAKSEATKERYLLALKHIRDSNPENKRNKTHKVCKKSLVSPFKIF